MSDYMGLKVSDCKNCHKCIRYCPVKAISYENAQANVLAEECILCGQCLVNCPQHAKEVRNDLGRAQGLLAGGAPVYVSLAPSFAAAFEGAGLEGMTQCLTQLGFFGVEETALGAAIVNRSYEALIAEGDQPVIITSCCHSVNLAIQKYFPEALPFLAKIKSPMLAHGEDIKRRHPGARVVFIGPCISKMAEAETYPGFIDCVLTFEELRSWLSQAGIPLPAAGQGREGRRTGLYPVAGGIIESMNLPPDSGYEYVVIDGTENCMAALRDIAEGHMGRCFVEMSACAGSCIGGPALGKPARPVGDRVLVNRHVGQEGYDIGQALEEQRKEIPFLGVHRPKPGGAAIEGILRQMGKTRPEQELNCGSCGYETCREKAEAILLGKAEISMCLPFLMEKAQSFSDTIIKNTPNGIIVLNRALEIQQLNAAACRLMNIDEADVKGRHVVCVLDPTPLMRVLNENRNIIEQRVWLAEYQRWVVMTVVHEKSNDIIFCLLRDVTQEEAVRSDRSELERTAVEIANRVIDKQMRTVQEIASLLGETAAETKVALTNLKESLHHE